MTGTIKNPWIEVSVITEIDVHSSYNQLMIMARGGKYYWSISDPYPRPDWGEIGKDLYMKILDWQDNLKRNEK